MERYDLYNFDGTFTGNSLERGTPVPPGFYRLVIHVCVFNSKGEMLIQQRQKKKTWSELWDISVGGHVIAGETSQQGAERELQEELGLSHSFRGMSPVIRVSYENGSYGAFGFDDYYIYKTDVEISSLKLQESEVQNAKWASLEEIKTMIDEKSFIPYHKGLIEFLFFNSEKSGVHTKQDWTKKVLR